MEKYILEAINGNKDAFALIFLSIQSKLYKIAFNRLKNEADALDAIQETIIIVYNNLKKLQNIDSFNNWVISILVNECNKIYNKKNKIKVSDISYEEDTLTTENINENLFFEDLLNSLNEKEKIVIILYYKNDYSIRKISKTLNIKSNTVKSIIKRAKEKIKKNLKE